MPLFESALGMISSPWLLGVQGSVLSWFWGSGLLEFGELEVFVAPYGACFRI